MFLVLKFVIVCECFIYLNSCLVGCFFIIVVIRFSLYLYLERFLRLNWDESCLWEELLRSI